MKFFNMMNEGKKMNSRSALLNVILWAMYRNKFFYELLCERMRRKAMQQQRRGDESQVDAKAILDGNNLRLDGEWSFRGKETIFKASDASGSPLVLKTGRIDPFQVRLFGLAKEMESKLCFKVPVILKSGDGWFLMEYIEGVPLNDFYDEKPDRCVRVSKEIADSYQVLIAEMLRRQSIGNLFEEGREWLFSRLGLWSKSIVDVGLIDFSLVQKLEHEFREVIARKGQEFFEWSHGNVIGDHILVSGNDFYLLDLNVVPRAGRGYHDFLRALDFMFLKSSDEQGIFESIPRWVRQYLSEFDENEVRLVLAFRFIGILGWDILHNQVEYVRGNLKEKKELALQFIRRT